MADPSSLFLDNLFFEKPVAHEVKPLQQEIGLWHLEVAPSLSQIPASQCILEEAESLFTLNSYSQKAVSFSQPSHTLKVFAGLEDETYFNKDNKKILESHGGTSSNSTDTCDALWEGEGFSDYYSASDRGRDGSLQDSSHVENSGKHLALDCCKDPPLRRSLFKVQKLKSGGDSDISNSSSRVSCSSSGSNSSGCNPTASRPQTFLSPVTMATTLPSQQLPRVTVCKADLAPLPRKPPLPPPLLGSSAACGRPPEETTDSEMPDKVTKRAFVPPMTPRPLCIQGSSGSGVLRPVSEIPSKFRSVFKEFPFFNYVQSKALDDILYTDKNFVACAPTGSGKTVLFELAIIRLLMETSEPWRDVKAVYIAPIKALCSQCFENWQKKFGPLGLICKELTGDTEIDDFFEIQDSHIILTTPEKWDSLTRKWKDNCLLQLVRLFLIDEVHVVKDTIRGATLEVVVSRMKAVHTYRTLLNPETGLSMRFVAVSATIPNISDIADWLSNESGPATYLAMDESHRPVKLRKVVLGFPCSQNQTEFKFDLSLNYRMASVIQTYSDQKPALVFCSTRKGAQQSAGVLAKDARFIMSVEHKQRLIQYGNSLQDAKLRDLVMLGVGYHHAGVSLSDRKVVEEAFTRGELPVLFTTRTLAMGVNLPAHLVVIKSTTQYVSGSCEEYSEADLLQMIGRAGRPQFDTSATAVIMTKVQTRDKYAKLMNGAEIIESSLHCHLVEHLNAEIVLQTVSDVNMALDWIRSTFLYIRALRNPAHYGFSTDLDRHGIEAKLQELCLKNLNLLSSIDLIHMDEVINIKPTDAGKLMARYCVAFDTMKQFCQVTGTENLSDLVELISKSREFSNIQLRVNEKKVLNTLNADKNRTTIRFPLQGKIKTNEMKVNCLIQSQLGSISIQEFGLTQETVKIFRNGLRISKCLTEFLSQKSKMGFSALLNSLILAKCFRAKLWENSPYVSKQLEKIGQTLSTAMVNAGLTTFSKIEQIHARELELIVNRHPPFGNQIKESVVHLPMYEVTLEQLPRYSCATAEIVVKVILRNQAQLLSKRTAPDHHYVSLILGDTDNIVVFLQKIPDMVLLKCGTWSKKIEVAKASRGEEISVNLISSEYVGLDIHQKFNVYYSGARRFGTDNPITIASNPTGQRPQQPSPNPPSRRQALSQQEITTFVNNQDTPNKRECNHFCKNKELCGHDCCKVGVSMAKKRSTGQQQESGFSSYLSDLWTRSDTLAQTPVKRLKMKMNETSLSVNMREFAYQPQAKLPSVSRYGRAHCETLVQQNAEIVDLTGGDGDDHTERVHADNADSDYCEYDGDMYMVEETSQTPSPPGSHHQSSFVWQKQETCGWSQGLDQSTNQINTSSSAYSQRVIPVTSQVTHGGAASSFQVPTVSFDLGNEWDDWSDFDDENLVRAAQTSYEPDPQIQMNRENKIPAAAIVTSSQTNMNTIRTPLRPISSMVRVRPENKYTLDCNNKRLSIFHKQQTLNTLGTCHKQMPGPQAAIGFDFFSTLSVGAKTSSHISESINNKEEDVFFGIFDGIL